jgi:class 3 adenylate cyclase/pimeloyl-ACP methyl ester carboxylesterase
MSAVDGDGVTRYVAVGDSDVAYQVFGEGDVDLLYFYGIGSHVEMVGLTPDYRAFFDRLAAFSRVIVFDRRGTGASDGVSRGAIPTLEEWTEDMRAVLDAVESKQVVIFAALDAGPIAILFAALHPHRVRALVLFTTTARYLVADDYPIGASGATLDALVEFIATSWGSLEFARALAPDSNISEEGARWSRLSATPRAAAAQLNSILRRLDVRQALPLIQAPTRVLHVRDSEIVPLAHGRYLAEHIEGAALVEIPGANLAFSPNMGFVFDELAELLTGERVPIEAERVLTTVVFTDIVGSTERAAALGDRRWRGLLDTHDQRVRDQLRVFRGREIKTTGDGFLASFDGPARAIRCGSAIIDSIADLGVEVRVGLHTGECEIRGDDLGGLAVHIAARVGALAGPGEILVSSTVKDLVVGSGIEFDDRGEHALKGVPGSWRILSVRR